MKSFWVQIQSDVMKISSFSSQSSLYLISDLSPKAYVLDLIAFSLPSFDFCRWAFIYVKITLFTYIAELFSIFPMYFLTKGIHDCDCLVVALTHVDFESLLILGWWNGRVWIAVWMVIIDENFVFIGLNFYDFGVIFFFFFFSKLIN